jgi:chromosome segregation ATPase
MRSDGSLLRTAKTYGLDLLAGVQPRRSLLASGDRAGNLLVWEGFTGREYLTLKGHTDAITEVSWRADSNILASASEDGSVRIWEMENGNQVRNWNAHGGGATSVEFARDGRLVTSGRDQSAKLWAQDGKLERQFAGFTDITLTASFCDETNRAVVADWTGAIRVFPADADAALGELIANPPTLNSRLVDAQELYARHLQTHQPLREAYELAEQQHAAARQAAETAREAHGKLAAELATRKAELPRLDERMKQTQVEEKGSRVRLKTLRASTPKLQQAAQLLAESSTLLGESPEGEGAAQIAARAKQLAESQDQERAQLMTRREALEKELGELAARREQERERWAALEQEVAKQTQNQDEAQRAFALAEQRWQEARAALEPVQAEVEAAEAAVQRWQDELEFVQAIRQLKESRQAVELELETLANRRQELVDQLAAADRQLEEAQTARMEFGQAEQSALDELTKARTELDDAVQQEKTHQGLPRRPASGCRHCRMPPNR